MVILKAFVNARQPMVNPKFGATATIVTHPASVPAPEHGIVGRVSLAEQMLTYGGGWLDRSSGLRTDPDWISSTLAGPTARVILLWRDQCLVSGEPSTPLRLPGTEAIEVIGAADELVYLGSDGGDDVFAADLSTLTMDRAVELAGADGVRDVRALVGTLTPTEAAVQAHARGLLYWHRHQRFCGSCGAPTESRNGGHLRACSSTECARLLFPRIEPAVIVLVEAPGTPNRCLLARHRGAPEGAYSTLAGFLEIGESLEDAVRREVAEEAGVRLTTVTYQNSQAWPFPAGLMVGFRAVAADEGICVDEDELVEARWFTRSELRERTAAGHRLGRPDSIDHYLLRTWLAEED
ncbi:NAD(+) diphosphatase [Micromonospora sonneratiae]